jgi:hypothetical protein
VEPVLRGSETRKVVDVYEIFWTGATSGDWNSTHDGERALFLLRVEGSRYRLRSLVEPRGFAFLGRWIAEKAVTGVAPARLYERNAPPEEIRRGVEFCVRSLRRRVLRGAGSQRDVRVAGRWAQLFRAINATASSNVDIRMNEDGSGVAIRVFGMSMLMVTGPAIVAPDTIPTLAWSQVVDAPNPVQTSVPV